MKQATKKAINVFDEPDEIFDGETPPYKATLTDWKAEPGIHKLRSDFDAANFAHSKAITKVDEWKNLIQVQGPERVKKVRGRSSVQPRLIRRQNEWRYSALSEPFLGTEKLFEVTPETAEDKPAAIQNELLLNHQIRTYLDRVSFFDQMVRKGVDEGTIIIQTGWKQVEGEVEVDVPKFDMTTDVDDMWMAGVQQALQMKQAAPDEYENQVPDDIRASVDHFEETGELLRATQNGFTKQKQKRVIANHPTAELLSVHNVRIDPSCGADFSKARYYTHTRETSLADLKRDGRYKNLEHINLESVGPGISTDHTTLMADGTFQFADKARKIIVVHEYWGWYDIHGTGVLTPIVAAWSGDVLIRMEENPFPDKELNLIVIPYMPVADSVYGETDAELLGDYQRIYGALLRGSIDLLGRSANSQTGIAKGMLDSTQRELFDRGQNYEYNPTNHPSQGIHTHTYPEMPASALTLMQLMNQEAEAITGVKSFSGGMSGESYGKVAAGIRGMLDAASKREMAIIRRLASGVNKLGKKWMAMNGEFLSKEEVVRVTNEEFVAVKRDELQGKFDLIVDISTAEVDDAKAEQLAFMLQTMGPNLGMDMVKMILSEIARLRRMPDLSKAIANFQPQPDPMVEAMKELEVAKVRAETARINAQAAKDEATVAKLQAETEQIWADINDQVNGVEHANAMEIVQAQAQGNADTRIVDSLLSPEEEGKRKPDPDAAIGYRELARQRANDRGQPEAPMVAQDPSLLAPPMPMDPGMLGEQPIGIPEEIDSLMGGDASLPPEQSINSMEFDPSQDPALNPAINL